MSNPKCKNCNENLSKDGIFVTSFDSFYIVVDDKNCNNKFLTIAYHTALDFFLEEISDVNENILEQNFYHTECVSEEIKKLLPSNKKINDYLYSGNISSVMQSRISVEKGKETRIIGKPKK